MSEDQVRIINPNLAAVKEDSPIRSHLLEPAHCYIGTAHAHASSVPLLH